MYVQSLSACAASAAAGTPLVAMAAPAALPEHVFVVPAAPSLPIIPTSAAVYPASAALLQQQRVAAALAAQANGITSPIAVRFTDIFIYHLCSARIL